MKLLVFNGSPAGIKSVTLQYMNYLQKKYPEHDLQIVHVTQQIRKLEKDLKFFEDLMKQVRNADLILWCFPVYIYLIPAGMKRFIELIAERGKSECFAGKYTIAVSTSIHFYDSIAQHYMHGILDDFQMKYLGNYSAKMGDLLKDEERKQFDVFIKEVLTEVEQQVPTSRRYAPVVKQNFTYKPEVPEKRVDLQGKSVLILSDTETKDSNLARMTEYLRQVLVGEVEIVNLNEIQINGGCLGCMKCTLDNECVYGQKDDIAEIYDVKMAKADIVIYAATIKDRFLSARFKMFMDRRFRKTHRPQLVGKQLGVLIEGPLSQLAELNWYLEAEAEVNDGNLAAVLSDEAIDSKELDARLEEFARKISFCAVQQYTAPRSFAGIGGKKVFRDDIWGELRFVFQADHQYYKEHGWYDFPQYNKKEVRMNRIMMILTKFPKIRTTMRKQMRDRMLKPYQDFLADSEKNNKQEGEQ